jgi:hypothetical protein
MIFTQVPKLSFDMEACNKELRDIARTVPADILLWAYAFKQFCDTHYKQDHNQSMTMEERCKMGSDWQDPTMHRKFTVTHERRTESAYHNSTETFISFTLSWTASFVPNEFKIHLPLTATHIQGPILGSG